MKKFNKFSIVLIISITLLIIGGLFVYLGKKTSSDYGKSLNVKVPKTAEEVTAFLLEHSNFYSIVTDKPEDYLPNEYFDINLNEKKIIYWSDNKKQPIEYKDYGNVSAVKQIQDANNDLSGLPSLDCFGSLIDPNYKKIIDSNEDLKTKQISYLYNAIAGYHHSYIFLGKMKRDSTWHYYEPSDFPRYRISKSKLITEAKNYIKESKKNKESLPCFGVNQIVETCSYKAVSLDRRADKIWAGNDSCNVDRSANFTNLQPPYEYQKLTGESACGWIFEKRNIVRATDYFSSKDYIYICNDTYDKLDQLTWTPLCGKPHIWWPIMEYCGYAFALIGLVLLVYILYVKFIKDVDDEKSDEEDKSQSAPSISEQESINSANSEVNRESNKNDSQTSHIGTIKLGEADPKIKEKDSKIPELERENKELKDQVNELIKKLDDANSSKKKHIEEYKESLDFKNDCDKIIEKYRKGEEYKNNLEKERHAAVDTFKKESEYKNLKSDAEEWKKILNLKSEKDLLSKLNSIRKQNKDFPTLRTLDVIYDEVQKKSSESIKQIATILESLDKQVGKNTGLQSVFQKLVQNSEYADEVRDRFEKCKQIANDFGDRNEYKQIVSTKKDLSIWDRVAVMLWAMNCTNELLAAFSKESFDTQILVTAAEQHKDDILQLFATRMFKRITSDPEKAAGALNEERTKKIGDKLAEIKDKYGVSIPESSEFNDYVKYLEGIHDRIKNEAVYIKIMKNKFVDEFSQNESTLEDKGQYLSFLIAMGLHMSDYIKYMNGNELDYCLNMKFALDNLDVSKLDKNSKFIHNDPDHSGDYANRVYEWLQAAGVQQLKALVGNKLILP